MVLLFIIVTLLKFQRKSILKIQSFGFLVAEYSEFYRFKKIWFVIRSRSLLSDFSVLVIMLSPPALWISVHISPSFIHFNCELAF